MNKKIMLIMIPLLVMLAFAGIYRISAVPTITIGVIGPYNLAEWGPGGMEQGADLAALEINAAGGINIGGTNHTVVLQKANEWAYDPATHTYDIAKAQASITALLAFDPDFIIGGFRTEVTYPIIEKVMDYNTANPGNEKAFFITGAATEQSDTPPEWYLCQNLTTPATYARYKWVFRNTPVNGTILVRSMIWYLGMYLFPKKILPMYGSPIKYGVAMEDLTWCDALYNTMNSPTGPYLFSTYFGLTATVPAGAAYRVPVTTTDFTSYLNTLQAAGVHIIVTAFTLPMVETLLTQIQTGGYHIMVVGIDVPGQEQEHWTRSDPDGTCNYEVLSNYAGVVPAIPGGYPAGMVKFWEHFLGNYSGHWPLYTAQGAYDGVYGIKEALEADGLGWTPSGLLDNFVAGRTALTGVIRRDAWQDLYSTSTDFSIYRPLGNNGYARNDMVQWINGSMITPVPYPGGVMSVVSPVDQMYSRKTQIPPAMYSLSMWDVNFDGVVDITDIGLAATAFMQAPTWPPNPQWNMEADVNLDGIVDISDIGAMATYFMYAASSWPLTS